MNEIMNTVSVIASASGAGGFNFDMAFYICLILGVLLLVIDVVLFFVLDIPGVYMILSGKGAKQTVKRMEQINAETGRLRNTDAAASKEDKKPKGKASGISKKLRKEAVGVRTQVEIVPPPVAAEQETSVLTAEPQKSAYKRITSGRFDIVYNTVYIHSNEII